MNKQPNDKGAKNSQAPKEKTELVVSSHDGQKHMGAAVLSRVSIGAVVRMTHFYDRVLALAELPKPEDLPKIVAVSQQSGIASIWNRARASKLENDAAALLTALAFSDRKQCVPLIRQFFKIHGLKVGLRGRPRLHPTQIKANVRGIQIDDMMARLREGFETKTQLKRAGGFSSGDESVAAELKTQGYNQLETDAILQGATLQDAAIRLFKATLGERGEHVELRTIRNDYAKYKRRRSRNQPS